MGNKINVIFFDIDGTVVSPKLHHISDALLDELARLRKKGIKLVIASGRPRHLIDNLKDFPFDGWITHNGCVVTAEEKTLATFPLDRERSMLLAVRCKQESIPVMCHTFDRTFISMENEETEWFFNFHGIPKAEIIDMTELLSKEDAYEFSLFIKPEREAEFLAPVSDKLMSLRWSPVFNDILPRGIDKSEGIRILLEHWGLKREESMAFGDGGNDVPMLKYSGTGIAMGNAADDVKAEADYVTSSVDEEGVIAAIRHFGI